MKTIKHYIVILLCISLCAPLAQALPAPEKRQDAQTTNTIAQDVLIIIQQEQVRFTAQKPVEEMQLQIFDQAGQLVYDSGAVTGPELTWVLRQANGEAVKSGLYAYTLSIKEVGKEAGAETARVRRGHFIVDRAQDRDGQTDRLWITSQNEGGVGTELTVARSEGETIAGASGASEQKSFPAPERGARDGEAESKNDNNGTAAVAANGATGQIAKFTSATNLGNSVMTESNGRIGVGKTSPENLLHVGPGSSSIGAGRVNAVVASNSTDAGIAIAQNSGVNLLLQASGVGAYIGTTSNHGLTLRTNDVDRISVTPNGKVAIGTIAPEPNSQLTVGNPSIHSIAVYAESGLGDGVYGLSFAGDGVHALSSHGHGVYGHSDYGNGVVGHSTYGYAGYFEGEVYASRLTKGSGSFKIDHPLDPENKYLSHSFVESPDMMNIYNGNVTTDARGLAVVTLPSYFTALNRDYRYQLTVVGKFAQAIVRSKIKGNRFVIRTDKPSVEVSWQVTGIRQDAFAKANPIQVEEEKTDQERGAYLNPEAFGQPKEKGVTHKRHLAATRQAEEETSKGGAASKRTATDQR